MKRAAGPVFDPDYLSAADRTALVAWLGTLHPLWEDRYPPGSPEQRRLLRPMYWLGNWQLACLGYYEPPRNKKDWAVRGAVPDFLGARVADIEERARRTFPPSHVPRGWHLNTCLVNFYGSRLDNDRWVDAARVGEHRDRERGPVASLSVGARARFQFVRPGERDAPARRNRVAHRWLAPDVRGPVLEGLGPPPRAARRQIRRDDRPGDRRLPHAAREPHVPLRARRHIVPFRDLAPDARAHVRAYLAELRRYSDFWAVSGSDA